jgi:uncharacterized membrane-anchored protein
MTTRRTALLVVGILLLLAAWFAFLPVAVNWPESSFGAIVVLLLAVGGAALICKAIKDLVVSRR